MRHARLERKRGKEAEQRKLRAKTQAFYDANGAAEYKRKKVIAARNEAALQDKIRSGVLGSGYVSPIYDPDRVRAGLAEMEEEKQGGYQDQKLRGCKISCVNGLS